MKYWLLTTEYPPFHGGGISTYCRETALMLQTAGVEVTVFVSDDSVRDRQVATVPAPTTPHRHPTGSMIPPDGHSASPGALRIVRFGKNRSGCAAFLGDIAGLSYEFASIVRSHIATDGKPDLIESQDYLGIAYYLLQYKALGYPDLEAIPILLTLHSPAFLYLEANRAPLYKFPDHLTGEMEKQAILMADHLVAPTQFIADILSDRLPLDPNRLSILRNPYRVSPDPVPAFTRNLPPLARNKIVCYGKLSAQKGSFVQLSTFKTLWDSGFPHPLHLIGGTDIVYHPEGLTMGQLVERDFSQYITHGLLVLHGRIDPALLRERLEDAHIIIFPSLIDNLPYAVIETMALGKVVLASIQGGQREMIDHSVNGFLFDHELPGDMAEKIKQILALSDEELTRIGDAAIKKCASDYDPGEIGVQKLELLNRLIARERATPAVLRNQFPFLHQQTGWVTDDNRRPDTLSVVIPYYNMGAYIAEAIASIQASTHRPGEILIIDDGSDDESGIAALRRWEGVEGIRIHRKKNEGLAPTRNFGARLATGKYLAFLDPDDKVDPGYYAKAIRVLARYENVFFAGCWVRYFGMSARRWATFTPQPPYLLAHNPINSSGLVCKTEAFLRAGLNDKAVGYGLEDYESLVAMMAAGYNGVAIPEFLFHYRVREDSMSRALTQAKWLYAYKYMSEKHRAYYAQHSIELINLLNANGPGIFFDNPGIGMRLTAVQENQSRLLMGVKRMVKRNRVLKRLALKWIKK